MNKFEPGKPACPNACKYCFITEHDNRREVWNKNPIAGINRACTYINVPPWIESDKKSQDRFYNFPWEILRGDFVGFTAISDPFWPKLTKYTHYFIEKTSRLAKAITCVTKWPISEEEMKKLSHYKNLYLVIGITGNQPPVEKFTIEQHLQTLALAKKHKVNALPIIHPYISGVSDLYFLPKIKNLGYDYISVKGLRYCHSQMKDWMPEKSREFYIDKENEEILPEDGWRKKIKDNELKLLSPKNWYIREASKNKPHLSKAEATKLVEKTMAIANTTTSTSKLEVKEAAIKRRL